MIGTKKLVNCSAVRDAFHRQGARVPHRFMEDLEQAVQVSLRRIAAGSLKPNMEVEIPAETYLKQSLLKEAIREALGNSRVDGTWVTHLNAMVVAKVSEESVRTAARTGAVLQTPGVPGQVLRAFLRSAEAKTMTVSAFFRQWQNPEFREAWMKRSEGKR